MIRNKLYYRIKPLVPARVRLAIRGWMARRVRDKFRAVWPILPGSEEPPKDWPGWPQGKQFAFVLTHDVEGPAGVAKCRQLAEVEKKYGFRSCFNFIPEGEYRVTRELRDELAREGFEVGVHDLRHDGRLFLNQKSFAEKAAAINRYLKDWGAVGFRSGFMLHNLDWLLDLDVAYDTSTFDTDPFEPQPDGTGTIFPFWKSGPNGRGYVELPYTLPQDSTMFLLMREPNTEIWFNKLDWIARHGGMALLNVHPDYLDFDPQCKSAIHYPLDRYESFLRHARERYGNHCWNVLPREVASWFKASCVTPQAREACSPQAAPLPAPSAASPGKNQPAKPDRAAVVLYSYYKYDVRPMREAEALANAGMEVDVICLRHKPSDPLRERINGVNLFRVPMGRRRSGKMAYVFRYAAFFISAFCRLAFWSFKKRYKLVHVHNMPDFLVFTALLPRLRGAKIILDLHDPMPELFCSIYGLSPNHLFARCLRFQERLSIAFADLVLTPNQAFKELFVSRSCPAAKIQITVNVPPIAIFDPRKYVAPAATGPRPFTLMYHGLLVERHGLDLALQAVAQLRPRIPQIKFHLYGEMTDYMTKIIRRISELGLDDAVQYHGFKSLPEIAQAIVSIDLGLVPNRLNDFTNINLPTRIFECLAMNKPVLVPRTRGIEDYFSDDDMLFFEPGNADDLAAKIGWVYQHPSETQSLLEKGRKVYARYSWDLEEGRFLGIVKDLLKNNSGPPSPRRAASPRRICMIAYSNYERDNRVLRYAEELAKRGDTVEVLALQGAQPAKNQDDGAKVRVFGILRRRKDQQRKVSYLLPILRFSVLCSVRLAWRHLRRPYDLIHVHNVPDFLVFTAWFPRLTGAKIILDIHDIVPEFYASKFNLDPNRFSIRMLKWVERASAHFAHHVIISNHLWRDKFAARTGVQDKCSVFINNVNQKIFTPLPRTRRDGKFIIVFPGGLQWHQGLDIALRAFQTVSRQFPEAEFHVYGDGNMKRSLLDLSHELGLDGKARFFDPLPLRSIARVMADADLGVVPKRADGFGNEAYSTKIMEFMSLGVPVVVSNTKIDQYYFNDSVVRFFESGNADSLTAALLDMISNQPLREAMAKRALEYAAQNSWDTRKTDYLNLVDSLCETRR